MKDRERLKSTISSGHGKGKGMGISAHLGRKTPIHGYVSRTWGDGQATDVQPGAPCPGDVIRITCQSKKLLEKNLKAVK